MPRVFTLACATMICLTTAMPCFAQAQEEAAPKSYVASYFILGLGIALGLAAICRPSKRRSEVRQPE